MFNEEGLLNKVVTAAVIGLLSWNTFTTQQLSIDVAVMTQKVDTAVMGAVSRSDLALLDSRMSALEKWNQNQSEELRVLEDTLSRLMSKSDK